MQSESVLVRLGDVVDFATGHPFKSSGYSESSSDVRLLRGDNIAQGYLRWADAKRWPLDQAKDAKAFSLQENDVVLAMDRPWIEAGLKFSHVRASDLPCLLVQRVARLRAKSVIDGRFLRYVVANRAFTDYILSVQTGTAVPHISGSQILAYQFMLPPMRAQQEIGDTLSNIDEQIDVLREMNATLEAIAQAIFKSWFIDFDPVKAKSEGRTPDGIDAETAALFPDSFEESALGAIPKGWTATPLRDVLTPIAERVGDSVVPEYASTNDGLVPREKLFNKQLSKSQANNKVIRRGDLVFGLSRATLNYGQMTDEIGSVSSAYKVFRVDSGKVVPVLLGRLISTRKEYFFNAVSASSREGQSVSTSSLERLQFACPPLSLQRALHSTLEPFLELIDCNLQEMATLAELRDTLLPRLISGKLKLPELQEVAEAV